MKENEQAKRTLHAQASGKLGVVNQDWDGLKEW